MKIFTHRYSFPSAKLLGEAMNCSVTSRPSSIKPDDIVLRYGRSDYLPNTCVGNGAHFIEVGASKLDFSRTVGDSLYTPKFYRNIPTVFPILVRESLGLSGGRGIHVVTTFAEFQQAWNPQYWWTPFIQTSAEFRAHCVRKAAGWEVFKLYKKIKAGEEQYPIRNYHRGYHFSLRNEVPPRLSATISSFDDIEIFNEGKFCAVDLAWVPSESRYVVFEINTAPGINKITAELLAKLLIADSLSEEE